MNNFYEYSFYLFFICLELILLFIGRNEKKPFLTYIALIIAILISGFRSGIGADYFMYERNFANIYKLSDFKNFPNLEPLYLLSNYIFKILGISFNGLLFFFSLITIIPLFWGLKKISPNPEFSFFLFIITNYYFISLNQIRQVIALSFFILSLHFLNDSKKTKYWFVNTVGLLFHYSAIITFSIYFIEKTKSFFTQKKLILVFFLSLLLSKFVEPILIRLVGFILPSFYADYLLSDFFLEKNNIAFLKLIFPSTIFFYSIYYWKEIEKQSSKFYLVFFIFSLGIFYYNIFYGKSIFIRPGFYFDICTIVWIPMLGSIMNKINRNILYISSIIYFICLLYLTIFIMSGQGVVPYKSILKF